MEKEGKLTDEEILDDADLNGYRTTRLIRFGLMQNDLDANFHKILNLDTSNLIITGIQTQPPTANKWFNSYDAGTQLFGRAQPAFSNLAGFLTQAQKENIDRVGTIHVGVWQGTQLAREYVPRLNDILWPDDFVNIALQQLKNVADPVDNLDAINLQTLNARLPGIQPKEAVKAASTMHRGLVGLGGAIDGISLSEGDRILLKNQQDAGEIEPPDPARGFQNGIWIASSGAWSRSEDCDTGEELNHAWVFVLSGNVNAGTQWYQSVNNPVINQDDIIWVLQSTTLDIVAGPGLNKIGNEIFAVGTTNRISISTGIDIAANYVGQTSLTTLGTITAGTWHGTVLEGEYGGTGVNNLNRSITLGANLVIDLSGDAIPEDLLTLLIIGTTTVTLPQTGTLATLAGNETFTNKHISASQIDSGQLAVARGGTGAGTKTDAINNLLPSQGGHENAVLKTDGVNVFWSLTAPGA